LIGADYVRNINDKVVADHRKMVAWLLPLYLIRMVVINGVPVVLDRAATFLHGSPHMGVRIRVDSDWITLAQLVRDNPWLSAILEADLTGDYGMQVKLTDLPVCIKDQIAQAISPRRDDSKI
jgi:hypothetical protein